ncbi:hypothetical protein TrVE_jg3497 [Triparma verrucosa]|uniref:Uncharacterized protein n=1 Tax=Triparma verrucosa TaxID=1606542 RepID=A0A9W7B9X4_9STRA|nr:hypothetical protein TrVE_jg3497 [Triparma verrucosa]
MAKPKLLITPTTIKVNRDIIKVTIMAMVKTTIIKVEFTIKVELKDIVKDIVKDRDIKNNEDICKVKLTVIIITTIVINDLRSA